MAFHTPLRYPGGKGRLGSWLAELMRHNHVSGGWYVEPYAGGAGAALHLLLQGYVNDIIINDIDYAVYSFWWAVINDTENFLDRLWSIPVSVESWERQKAIYSCQNAASKTDLGFAAFFLNRTNRSGIMKGGIIGGKNQKGKYKIDARFNKDTLSKRIQRIAFYGNSIHIYNLDALVLIKEIVPLVPSKMLIYLDPPYFNKGAQLYRNHYTYDDHCKIAETLKRFNYPWVLTYDWDDTILGLYDGILFNEFSIFYSTNKNRPQYKELLFYKNLTLHSPPYLRR